MSGVSYVDIMLSPVAEALGSSLPIDMPIYFSLQGEMGATVFRYACVCVTVQQGTSNACMRKAVAFLPPLSHLRGGK